MSRIAVLNCSEGSSRKARFGTAVAGSPLSGGVNARRAVAFGAVALSLAASTSAGAAAFTFDFNTLGEGANSTSIHNYMTGVFGSNVGVSGAKATKAYNGDGHVVGPTLGTSDGATSSSDATHNHANPKDTFIINDGPGSNSFTLNFGTFSIFSLSFDWEIFPDNSCSPHCAPTSPNWPDIELLVDGNPAVVWSMVAPGDAHTLNPQAIGVSGLINLAGAHTLTFMDWPAEIGIDNLVINGCPPTAPQCLRQETPEPPSLPLTALALGALFLVGRRSRGIPDRRPS